MALEHLWISDYVLFSKTVSLMPSTDEKERKCERVSLHKPKGKYSWCINSDEK